MLWWFPRRKTPQLPRIVLSPEDGPAPTICEGSAQSSVTALSVSPGAGWGKVVAKGKSLGVSFGTPNSRSGLSETDQGATAPRLEALRRLMREEPEPLKYYIVPTEDAHQSEYISPADARREYISNFTGSAGVAIVSETEAHLFVDSRYWIQAEREIDSNWTLHKVGSTGEVSWLDWIRHHSVPEAYFGVDSRLISCQTAAVLATAITDRRSKLVFPRLNLVDASRTDRPSRPNEKVIIHELRFAGQPASEKIQITRDWIQSWSLRPNDCLQLPESLDSAYIPLKNLMASTTSTETSDLPFVPLDSDPLPPTGILITALDSIAWLLNLRGSDVPFNPVFFAYIILTLDSLILFIDPTKPMNDSVIAYLIELGVTLKDYGDVWTYLKKTDFKGQLILDARAPYAAAVMLTRSRYTIHNYSYVDQLKAVKNPVEIEGFRQAYLRDGAAYVCWLAWLEETIRKKKQPVTEWGAAQKLTEYRMQLDHYMGLAYDNISATGANAALPHYKPTRTQTALIDIRKPYLNDSGGQYLDGTCDTTRTVHFGSPTNEQRDAYTRVLKGHIAIETTLFPAGTAGAQLDVLARRSLWGDRLNYGHGTGHGFGSFLSVHEGPHSFGNAVQLKAGCVITNEPGYYKENDFGIRIESALLIKEVLVKSKEKREDEGLWLGFERFTQVPIQTAPFVNYSLLTREERRWLRRHNQACRDNLMPLVKNDKRAVKWLKRATGTIGPIEIIWE